MKKWLKYALLVPGSLVVLAGSGAGYLYAALPNARTPEQVTVKATPELLARGQYLVEAVAACTDCHSQRDYSRFAAPIQPDSKGGGGERFGREIGLPGDIYSRNITPSALGNWSDGEVMRAVTDGVSKDGTPLFPLMPYPAYSHLCDRDLDAIVAYLRTLKPVNTSVPKTELDFPVNMIVRTMPRAAEPWACPDTADSVTRGKYLVTMASCTDCHTKREDGKAVAGMDFAGGAEFPLPTGGTVRSSNITSDKETGIGNWTKAQFIARFQVMKDPAAAAPVPAGGFNTPMPWTHYAHINAEDLGAMYDYLKSLPAVKNPVERFTPSR